MTSRPGSPQGPGAGGVDDRTSATKDPTTGEPSGLEATLVGGGSAAGRDAGSAATAASGGSDAPVLAETLEQAPAAPGGERYATRSLLGEGGMGEVWLSRDVIIGRDVALKRLRVGQAGSEAMRRRFLREARIQALMEHPTVVPVYDLDATPDGSAYFTMRRVRGLSLDVVLRGLADGDEEMQRRFSRRKLLTALVNVSMAVHYAHLHGVIHRDLKPANIMLGEFGEVYLLDWGVAKLVRPTSAGGRQAAAAEPPLTDTLARKGGMAAVLPRAVAAGLTQSGQSVGTLAYMAPEQLAGLEVDVRADIYALGAILYEVLTLRALHPDCGAVQIYAKMSLGKLLDLEALRGAAPELVAVCRQATAFSLEDRFASARDLAEAVERFLDGDRDLEARRKAAAELAQRAGAAADRAYASGASAETASEAHTEAMDAAVRALAFDPESLPARRVLARVLVEVPERLPQAAEAAQREATQSARLTATRFAGFGFLSWLVVVPFVVLLGIRSWLPIALAVGAQVVGLGLAVYFRRLRRPGPAAMFGLAGLALVSVALFSVWLGPFVLVPVAAATATFIFVSQATPRERPFVVLLGVLAAGLPLLAEWVGLVPPSYAIVGDNVVLFARALDLPPLGTNLALLYTSVAFCIGPALIFGAMRDALARAERRLFLQAWQLRRLTGDEP